MEEERCSTCNIVTGKGGLSDDSLYLQETPDPEGHFSGPYCWDCYDERIRQIQGKENEIKINDNVRGDQARLKKLCFHKAFADLIGEIIYQEPKYMLSLFKIVEKSISEMAKDNSTSLYKLKRFKRDLQIVNDFILERLNNDKK